MTKIIATDRARQGGWGRHVLLILVACLLLVGAVWIGLEFYGEAIAPPSVKQAAQDNGG